MSRYAALPAENQFELGNASDSEGDSDDEHVPSQHRRPGTNRPSSPTADPLLNPRRSRSPSPEPVQQASERVIFDADGEDQHLDVADPLPSPPGAYDYPPPGSPPRASGNSNGVPLPSGFTTDQPGPSYLRRALGAILPTHYGRNRAANQHGGGLRNDGVFTNMAAKPIGSAGMVRGIDDVDNPDWVPEIAQSQGPPSYAHAQADSVPPYYEAALGNGHTFTSPMNSSSQLLIDNMPPGSLFSFLWNLLVSLSFQFVGFLLTYLLHTSHAAKQGSRAGLGITLIQYGFYLRQRAESLTAEGTDSAWHKSPHGAESTTSPTYFPTASEADAFFATHVSEAPTATPTSLFTESPASRFPRELSVANEWLSFFLMTIGWFVLLTSVLGYWRVKRWEMGVRRQAEERAREEAREEAAAAAAVSAGSGDAEVPAPAEEERRRMAVDLNALLERLGMITAGLGLPVGAAARGRRAAEQAGEEGHRLEAVD